MKELLLKGVKFAAACLGVVVSIWAAGWGAGIVLNAIFDSKIAIAEIRVEDKIMKIHGAAMAGINGKIDVIQDQNTTIIKQNYKMMGLIKRID